MVIIGLKKRDTFEEVVEYIKNSKDVIKFPDRYAKQIRNSFELSQLDGVGMMEHEEHELQTMKETEKANALRKVARNSNDTSHVELLAHSRQSRPAVNTSSTIQQTDPVHHVIHTDSGYETGAESSKEQYRTEAGKLRDEAELEHRVLQNNHIARVSNLVDQHSNDLLNLSSYHESRHHEAQAFLRNSMNMDSQAQQQMNDQQSLIREQRHQAELANQQKKFESRLSQKRGPVVEEPKEKRLIVTRSIAEAVQQDYTEGGSSGSTDVPMAIAPPSTTKKKKVKMLKAVNLLKQVMVLKLKLKLKQKG